MTPARDFGQRVRQLRTAAGLSQLELARRAKMHRVSVARIEAGRTQPNLAAIERLARALRVTSGELLDGDETRMRKRKT